MERPLKPLILMQLQIRHQSCVEAQTETLDSSFRQEESASSHSEAVGIDLAKLFDTAIAHLKESTRLITAVP
jgi:hypothetical protein